MNWRASDGQQKHSGCKGDRGTQGGREPCLELEKAHSFRIRVTTCIKCYSFIHLGSI